MVRQLELLNVNKHFWMIVAHDFYASFSSFAANMNWSIFKYLIFIRRWKKVPSEAGEIHKCNYRVVNNKMVDFEENFFAHILRCKSVILPSNTRTNTFQTCASKPRVKFRRYGRWSFSIHKPLPFNNLNWDRHFCHLQSK